jgi:hypothetical protein
MTPEQTPKERGRPSLYTPEIAAEICARLADGETLRAICRDVHMPSERTVRSWAMDDLEGFSPQYAKARELGYATLFDQMLEIADTPRQGVIVTEKATGTETKTADMIEHRRLQVDTRKWMLSKALPKVYGDRIETVAKHQIVDENEQPLASDELARHVAFLLTSGMKAKEKQADSPPLH